MDIILSLIEQAGPVVAGVGITWLVSWRRAKRHFERRLSAQEYAQVDQIVERFTRRITDQAMQHNEILNMLMKIEQENTDIIRENRALKEQLEQCKKNSSSS